MGATERDEAARQQYRERVAHRPPGDVVVVDETGANINLTPHYARAPQGQRAYGQEPRNTPKNTTLIAALTADGISAAMLLGGATDTAAFEVYIAQFLAPTLRPGQIVVLDNLSAHQSAQTKTMIEAQGCELWFLPAYSPDLSPIEEAFSKIKERLRPTAARTRAALEDAMAQAIATITAQDALGYLTHCGYSGTLDQAQ